MKNGVIKRFNHERGFGFITPEGSSSDVFVHIKALRESGINECPPDGTRVQFEVERGDRGDRAIKIQVLA